MRGERGVIREGAKQAATSMDNPHNLFLQQGPASYLSPPPYDAAT